MSRINEFKEKISLVDYILSLNHLNFQISDNSKRNEIRMFRTNQQGDKVDSILVSRFQNNEKEYDHWFPVSDDWKGKSLTIVDFIHQYVLQKDPDDTINFGQIFGIMDQYIKSEIYIHPNESYFTQNPKFKASKTESNQINFDLKSRIKPPQTTMFDYLKSRRINKSTYLNEIFVGSYCTYVHEFPKEEGKPTIVVENPAFLYLNQSNKPINAQQIVVKNETNRDKYFIKNLNKGEALFKTQRKSDSNNVIFLEAPEKAMAHFQLKEKYMNNSNTNPYYLATGGNLNEEQLNHFKSIVREKKLRPTIAFDNDAAGEFYTIKSLAYLISDKLSVEHRSKVDKKEKDLIVTIYNNPGSFKSNQDEKEYYQIIKNTLDSLKIKLGSEKNIESLYNKDSVQFRIEHNKENFNYLKNLFSEVLDKDLNIKVEIEKSITKDWVDDLEYSDNLKTKNYNNSTMRLDL